MTRSDDVSSQQPLALPPDTRRYGFAIALSLLVALACVVWIALTRYHWADEPLNKDVCWYLLKGRAMAEGRERYIDIVEFMEPSKPPGMFVIWQLTHMLAGTSPTVVVWVEVLTAALTMLGVYWAGSAKPWGRAGGLWAMGFWTLICGDLKLEANQPNMEVFMNLFTVWGLAVWVRADMNHSKWYRYALAGAFLTLASFIKHSILITAACMGLAWILSAGTQATMLKRRLLSGGVVVAIIAAAWLLLLSYFALQGRAGDFYNYLILYANRYAQEGGNGGLLMNVVHGARLHNLFPPSMYFLSALVALSATALAVPRGRTPQSAVFLACLLGTFVGVSMPGRFYPHYYQLYLPLLAVGGGWGVAALATGSRWRVLGPCGGMAAVLLLLCHVGPEQRLSGKECAFYKRGSNVSLEVQRCGHVVKGWLQPNETFFAWADDPGVYYYSHRRPASRELWPKDWVVTGEFSKRCTQMIIDDLNCSRPSLVLMLRSDVPDDTVVELAPTYPVARWIQEHCVLAPEARFSDMFDVYIRPGSALAKRLPSWRPSFTPGSSDVENLDYFPRILDVKPNDAEVRARYGEVLGRTGRTDEAIVQYQRALDIDPGIWWVRAKLVDALIQRTRFEEAIAQLQETVRISPQLAEVHDRLGGLLADAGRIDDAIVQFQKVLEIDPDSAGTHAKLGHLLIRRGRPDEGIVHLQRVVDLDPKSASAYYDLGLTLANCGKAEQAIRHYQQALKINPKMLSVHLRLGKILFGRNELDGAIAHFRAELALDPAAERAALHLGDALAVKGQFDEATAAWQQVLRFHPKCAQAHTNIGKVLRIEKRYDDSIAHFQKALEIDPDFVPAHIRLAEVLTDCRRFDEAMVHWEKVLKLTPEDHRARNSLKALRERASP